MKVVVCDDDPTLRGVVSKLVADAGLSVLAETDSAVDAVDLVRRFGADVLVLDLALPWTGGGHAIRELRSSHSACQVVVFTAYPGDDPITEDSVVRSVVEKPDFDRLESVLRDLAITQGAAASDRRKPAPDRPRFPTVGEQSPSGLEDAASFGGALESIEAGDVVLVVHVAGIDGPEHRHGRLVVADRLLAVVRTLRGVLRVQDRLTLGDDDGELTALLLNAGRLGVTSVWQRLERAHEAAEDAGVLSGGWALFAGTEAPTTTAGRARDAAHRSVGQEPGDRLWAG